MNSGTSTVTPQDDRMVVALMCIPPHHVYACQPHHDRLVRTLERVSGQPASIDTYGRPVAPTGAAGVIGANTYLYVMNDRPEVEFAVYSRRHADAGQGVLSTAQRPGGGAYPAVMFRLGN
jgi:hypothetical protein